MKTQLSVFKEALHFLPVCVNTITSKEIDNEKGSCHVYKDTEKHYPTNLDLFLSTSIKKKIIR